MVTYKLDQEEKYLDTIKLDQQGFVYLAAILNSHIDWCQETEKNKEGLSVISKRCYQFADKLLPQILDTLEKK